MVLLVDDFISCENKIGFIYKFSGFCMTWEMGKHTVGQSCFSNVRIVLYVNGGNTLIHNTCINNL